MRKTLTEKPPEGKNSKAPADSGRPLPPGRSIHAAGPSRAPQRSAVPPSPAGITRPESQRGATVPRRGEHRENAAGARSGAEGCESRAPGTAAASRRPTASQAALSFAQAALGDPTSTPRRRAEAETTPLELFPVASPKAGDFGFPKIPSGSKTDQERAQSSDPASNVAKIGVISARILSGKLTEDSGPQAPQAPSVDRKLWRTVLDAEKARKRVTIDPEGRRAKRAELWKLKEWGAKWLPERTRNCHSHRIGGAVDVAVWLDDNGQRRANYRHLETCSNANICPLCAIRIRSVRAMDLAEQAAAWCEAHGGRDAISLLTLTMRHNRGHTLRELLDGEHKAWKLFKERIRNNYAAAWGWTGEVRADDTTYGENGWHPHFHIMVFWDSPPSASERRAREEVLRELWASCVVQRMGEEHKPNAHGVDLSGGADAARYLMKLAFELSDPLSKKGKAAHDRDHEKGRTPFELLRDASIPDDEGATDERAGFLFREYGAAFKGRRVFEYSRRGDFKATLRRMAGQDEEQTDAAIMEGGNVGTVELQIPGETWTEVCRVKGVRAELLSIVERSSGDEAKEWLHSSGLWRRPMEEFHAWLDEPLSFPETG